MFKVAKIVIKVLLKGNIKILRYILYILPVMVVILENEVIFHIIMLLSTDPLANNLPSVVSIFNESIFPVWLEREPTEACVVILKIRIPPKGGENPLEPVIT